MNLEDRLWFRVVLAAAISGLIVVFLEKGFGI